MAYARGSTLAVFVALMAIPSSLAQTEIPVEMTITALHKLVVTGAQDVSFSYDGQTMSPGESMIILCVQSTASDVVLDVGTQNATQGSFNALQAANIGTHISYKATGAFDLLNDTRTLLDNSSEAFDLSSVSTGQSGCLTSDYAFSFEIAPITQSQSGAVSIDETVAIEDLVGTGTHVFTDVITLEFYPNITGPG